MKPRSKGEYNNIKRLHPRGCGDELILDKLIAIKNYYSIEYNYNYSRPDLQNLSDAEPDTLQTNPISFLQI